MALRERVMAAIKAWRDYGRGESAADRLDRYQTLWGFWLGEWRNDPLVARQRRDEPRLYENTRLLWNIARSTVRLYSHTVYQGALATDGAPRAGAIPLVPLTGSAGSDRALLAGCASFWRAAQWQQQMSLAPKYAAVLGDCLVELVDDRAKGLTLPRHVWPGYVVEIELDLVGNVKAYALEYQVVTAASTAFGRPQAAESYRFRKEVDGRFFRYYRDEKPYDYFGPGSAVQPNPYGFVPAVWYRHEVVPGERGLGAFEAALGVLREQNGVLSHALDYQRKQFAAPVGVVGAAMPRRVGPVTLPRLPSSGDPVEDAEQQSAAQNLLPLGEGGKFVTIDYDTGRTAEMTGDLGDRLLAEFPEAMYFQELLQMTQVTGPGVERALGPITGNVIAARANHDPQTVKLHQMALAMMGWRLANGDYPAAVVAARPDRYEPFRPFDLTSYGRGLLDMEIAERPVIAETIDERVARLLQIQTLEDPWMLEQAGVPPEVVARMQRDREARRAEMQAAFSGAGAGGPEDDTGEQDHADQ